MLPAPTLVFSSKEESPASPSLFSAFRSMLNTVGRRNPPALSFVIKRGNHDYDRPRLEEFVRLASHVSNHPYLRSC